MTPFAHLGQHTGGLEKPAFLKGLHGLVRDGLWKSVALKAKPDGRWGKLANKFFKPVAGELDDLGRQKMKSTGLYKGLVGYGTAGMLSPLAGVNLPGSSLAFNSTMPGLGALFSAPSLITTGRMASKKNQDALQQDVIGGGRQSAVDLLHAINMDPSVAYRKGCYRQLAQEHGGSGALDMADRYSTGSYKPMGAWHTAGSMFENPDALIGDQVDKRLFSAVQGMGKKASFGSALKGVFPWLFPAMGAGWVGHSIMRDKPYNVQDVRDRGYAAGQAGIMKKLDGMSGFERMMARLDPTLVAGQVDKAVPGTLKQWEGETGSQFRPGWMAGIKDSWSKGGKRNFYTLDMAGNRHYTG